jgi:diaminopimelate decarboxylase
VWPVCEAAGRRPILADIVGPICETGDFLSRDREVPDAPPGDLLAVMSAGAYGFTMASNYCSRLRLPEVMVRNDAFDIIRKRQTYDDLIAGESVPDFL